MRKALSTYVILASLLVLVAVLGRVGKVDWNVTPLAAVTLVAGYLGLPAWLALLVPTAAIAVSNFFEPQYGNVAVAVSVYLSALLPVALGRWMATSRTTWQRTMRSGVSVLVPSLVFFLVTNFAHWAFTSYYPHTSEGLVACYAAGIPFYRNMLAGDLFFSTVAFGAVALAAGSLGRAAMWARSRA